MLQKFSWVANILKFWNDSIYRSIELQYPAGSFLFKFRRSLWLLHLKLVLPVKFLHIFRTPFLKKTSGWLLLLIVPFRNSSTLRKVLSFNSCVQMWYCERASHLEVTDLSEKKCLLEGGTYGTMNSKKFKRSLEGGSKVYTIFTIWRFREIRIFLINMDFFGSKASKHAIKSLNLFFTVLFSLAWGFNFISLKKLESKNNDKPRKR